MKMKFNFSKIAIVIFVIVTNLSSAISQDFSNSKIYIFKKYNNSRDSCFERIITKCELFTVGEIHGKRKNANIVSTLIKQINSIKKIKYIALEVSPTYEYAINKYIKTGDEIDLLNDFYKYNIPFEYFSNLRKLYNSQGKNYLFQVKSLDYQYFDYDVVDFLLKLKPQNIMPKCVQISFSLLENLQINSYRHLLLSDSLKIDLLKKLYNNLIFNESEFRNSLDSNFYIYQKVILSSYYEIPYWNMPEHIDSIREYYMYEQLSSLMNNNDSNTIIFAQVGVVHVSRCHQNEWITKSNWNSLITLLVNDRNTEGKYKIVSTIIYYKEIYIKTMKNKYISNKIQTNKKLLLLYKVNCFEKNNQCPFDYLIVW